MVYTFGSSLFSDADGDALYYSAALLNNDGTTTAISTGATWITLFPNGGNGATNSNRRFRGTPASDNSNCGSVIVQVSCTDNIAGTVAATGTFHLRVDCTPEISTITISTNAMVGHAYSYTIPSTLFTDQDAADTLTFSDQSTGSLWASKTKTYKYVLSYRHQQLTRCFRNSYTY